MPPSEDASGKALEGDGGETILAAAIKNPWRGNAVAVSSYEHPRSRQRPMAEQGEWWR
jgi:hypothetical protein